MSLPHPFDQPGHIAFVKAVIVHRALVKQGGDRFEITAVCCATEFIHDVGYRKASFEFDQSLFKVTHDGLYLPAMSSRR
jgi:hypothetical protein